MRRHQPGAIAGGLSLLLMGGWLLATSTGVPLLGFNRIWPVIPVLFGLVLLVQYVLESREQGGLVFLGVAALLSGVFLFVFTLQIGRLTWGDMSRYWPVFLIIAGAAFMTLYLAEGMREQALLIPTYIIGGIGLFTLPFTLGVFRGAIFSQMLRLWPLPLILIALAIFFRPRSQGQSDDAGTE